MATAGTPGDNYVTAFTVADYSADRVDEHAGYRARPRPVGRFLANRDRLGRHRSADSDQRRDECHQREFATRLQSRVADGQRRQPGPRHAGRLDHRYFGLFLGAPGDPSQRHHRARLRSDESLRSPSDGSGRRSIRRLARNCNSILSRSMADQSRHSATRRWTRLRLSEMRPAINPTARWMLRSSRWSSSGLDSGFDNYRLTDPVIIGDVTADGTLSGLDAYYVARTGGRSCRIRSCPRSRTVTCRR